MPADHARLHCEHCPVALFTLRSMAGGYSKYIMTKALLQRYSKKLLSVAQRLPLILGAVALGMPVMFANNASAMDTKMRRGEQSEARQQLMAGQVKSLREIESRILPRMRGMEYIGPEYDPVNQVYRLKFLKDDRVVFVDVDARSGAILRQIG